MLFRPWNTSVFYISTSSSLCAVPSVAVWYCLHFLLYCYVAQVQSEWFQLPITTGLSLLLLLHHYPFSSGPVWTCLLIAPCRVCVSLFNGEREPAKPVACLAVRARWGRASICVACAIKCFVENRSCYGAAGHGPQDCTGPAEGWVTMRTECTG